MRNKNIENTNKIIQKVKSIFHPEYYRGWGKTKKYFEGWYYKVVNAEENKIFAFIPGISMDENGTKQAFIQVLEGKNLNSKYNKFDVQEFLPKIGKFEIQIASNFFSSEKIILALPTIKGELNFKHHVDWPSSWYSPGIMGPFAFVPFMECYHGILSMDHIIQGQLVINDETVDFTNGRGYMEKDWGHSFPSAYIWIQTNHFSNSGISLIVSVAKIPWLGCSFVGFIAGLWFNNEFFEFTTYNFSKLSKSIVDNKEVKLVLENRKYRLEIIAHRKTATELASPISGFMDGRISESMTAEIDVKLYDKKNKKIFFQDTGRNAGLEVTGKIQEITICS